MYIECQWFELTYYYFRRQLGPQLGLQRGPQWELFVLPTIVLSWAYVLLQCPLAKDQGIQEKVSSGLYLSARVPP